MPEPIVIRVNTLWEGKAGVRDRYVEEAAKSGAGLCIIYGQDRMEIAHRHLAAKMVGKSARSFRDKFSRGSHRLCYYVWRPTSRQGALFEAREEMVRL